MAEAADFQLVVHSLEFGAATDAGNFALDSQIILENIDFAAVSAAHVVMVVFKNITQLDLTVPA